MSEDFSLALARATKEVYELRDENEKLKREIERLKGEVQYEFKRAQQLHGELRKACGHKD